ncbi:hypothetical protein SKAU_G00005100 [Synaphobranchus kaupii]|uniref:Uncharacterized protein n=1 Tax=Synaphobranchus kaupii TaxID=118154 RepID=A0A9Q1G929_SYNKA|nr:hypothetical protein SKAU_G00005100 [Synaphobranchus kaupii]
MVQHTFCSINLCTAAGTKWQRAEKERKKKKTAKTTAGSATAPPEEKLPSAGVGPLLSIASTTNVSLGQRTVPRIRREQRKRPEAEPPTTWPAAPPVKQWPQKSCPTATPGPYPGSHEIENYKGNSPMTTQCLCASASSQAQGGEQKKSAKGEGRKRLFRGWEGDPAIFVLTSDLFRSLSPSMPYERSLFLMRKTALKLRRILSLSLAKVPGLCEKRRFGSRAPSRVHPLRLSRRQRAKLSAGLFPESARDETMQTWVFAHGGLSPEWQGRSSGTCCWFPAVPLR